MKDSRVIVVTGCEIDDISNLVFDQEVLAKSTHTLLLQKFMRENKFVCYDDDFCTSYEAVQLAAMGNVVFMISKRSVVAALPVFLSDFQKEYINSHRSSILSDDKLFCIMNLYEEKGKKYYEGISSAIAKSRFDDLIFSKNGKVKKL